VRAPEVKKAVVEKGGSVEVRLLPLTKMHDWAFPAAETRELALELLLRSGGLRDGPTRSGAMRLGLSGTPSFLHDGNFVSGERELFEAYLRGKLAPAPKPEAAPASKPTGG
jgi:hypothetical protein